jgi:hypothetical protein
MRTKFEQKSSKFLLEIMTLESPVHIMHSDKKFILNNLYIFEQ